MSAPQEGYPQQGYPAADPYGQQPQYGEQPATSPPPHTNAQAEGAKKKKGRGYATQAYEFGAGGNSALGQGAALPAGGAFQPAAPAYGGYQAPDQAQQPLNALPQQGQPAPVQPSYGQPMAPGGAAGYQPPAVGYPGPGASTQGGVQGITHGMSQTQIGGAGQAAGQPQSGGRPAVLNQLYPTDLLNQPFNVAELDLPPPPIILPENVRAQVLKHSVSWLTCL